MNVRHGLLAIPCSLCLLLTSTSWSQTSAALAGRWEAPSARQGNAATFVFIFKVEGNTFTGTGGTATNPTGFTFTDGTINGDKISFNWLRNGQRLFLMTGKLYDNQLNLIMEFAPEHPGNQAGKKSPLTAFRNPGKIPIDWTTSEDH